MVHATIENRDPDSSPTNCDIDSASVRARQPRIRADETWSDFLRRTSIETVRLSQEYPNHIARDIEHELPNAQMMPTRPQTTTLTRQDAYRKQPFALSNDHGRTLVAFANATDTQALPQGIDDADPPTFQGSSAIQVQASSSNRPRWQPDAEASACPACKAEFTWYFRRHHCRKCGRVICTNCSQHKITIPRQFVVQPPHQSYQGSNVALDKGFLNLSGAETVRVCNPCVPDPNFSPPSQSVDRELRYPHRRQLSSPTLDTAASQESLPSRNRTRLSDWAPSADQDRFGSHLNSARRIAHPMSRVSPTQTIVPPHSTSQRNQRRSTLPTAPLPSAREPQHAGLDQTIEGRCALPIQGYRSRPQLAEEDECPVCGNELPPRSTSNDDAARARHIDECIRSYASYPTRSNLLGGSTNAATPSLETFPTISIPVHTAAEPNGLESVPGSSRSLPPALANLTSTTASVTSSGYQTPLSSSSHAHFSLPLQRRLARMLEYKANEKDCVDERGDQQECIICFEEFEVGDALGRLECMCKFHKHCILGWWKAKETSRPASGITSGCPTHVLQI